MRCDLLKEDMPASPRPARTMRVQALVPYTPTDRINSLHVLVRDNNVDQALKVLKKKMQREGLFKEFKRRSFYEKPSERKVREKAEQIRRARKLRRKQAQREGLIPAPKPKRIASGRR